MHRLFVALRPPPPIRAALLSVMDGVAGARWQDDEQLHVTVRFLGEVDRHQADDVAAALAAVRATPPAVRIDGVGTFDTRGHVDTLWARITPAEPLAALHRKVNQALARAGIAPDPRRYLPHVTLARFGRRASTEGLPQWIDRHAALATRQFTMDHVLLFESRLDPEGARYEAVARWRLAR